MTSIVFIGLFVHAHFASEIKSEESGIHTTYLSTLFINSVRSSHEFTQIFQVHAKRNDDCIKLKEDIFVTGNVVVY